MHKFKIWINKVIFLIVLLTFLGLITKMFGAESAVTNFIKDKVIFTPFNIVGIIMVALAPFGIWFGRKGGGKLFSTVSAIALFLSLLSFIACICGIIGIGNTILPNTWKTIQKMTISVVVVLIIIILVLLILKLITKAKCNTYDANVSKNVIKTNVTIPFAEDIKTVEEKINNVDLYNTIVCKKKSKHIDDYADKIASNICPICGGRLKSRRNHKNRRWFVGCKNYFSSRNCNFTMDYPIYKKIKDKCC